jgi:hypothetical protein
MKYVVTWTPRAGGSGHENEASRKRAVELLGKWIPQQKVHEILVRIDGQGGFAVVETDEPESIARTIATFSPYLVHSVYPVLEIDEARGIAEEAIAFLESH